MSLFGIFSKSRLSQVNHAKQVCRPEQPANKPGVFRGRKVEITVGRIGRGMPQQGAAGRDVSAGWGLSLGLGIGAPEKYVISMQDEEGLVEPGRRVVPIREKLASIKQKCESTSWFQSPLKRFFLQLQLIVLYLKNRN